MFPRKRLFTPSVAGDIDLAGKKLLLNLECDI